MKHAIEVIRGLCNKILFILSPKQKSYGIVVVICSLLGAILEVLGVGVILPLVQAFMNADMLFSNRWLQIPIVIFHISNTTQIIVFITVIVIFIFLLKNLYFIFLSWLRMKYSCKVSRELSSLMMSTYMNRGYEFFLSRNTSDISRNINADVSGVNTMLYQIMRILIDCLTIILIVAFIFYTDWRMALSITLLAIICLLLIYFYFRVQMKKAGEVYNKYNGITSKYLLHALHGIKEIIVMHKQHFFVNKFESANAEKQKASIKQTVGAEAPAFIIEGICVSGLLGTVCLRITTVGQDALALVPALSSFAVGAFRILPSLGRISSAINTSLYYMPSLNNVYQNLKDLSGEERDSNVVKNEEHNLMELNEFEDKIDLVDICWHYKETEKEVLSHLNLSIKKGQSVAFVGLSGAGKTTLADILLGLLIPEVGDVLIDGKSIKEFDNDISHIMGYVPQAVYLTDDTISNNIAFGVGEKEINIEKIWDCLEQAQMKDFVLNLPNKLDTAVGDRGVRFSGGQRQRIAIARALYNSPEILVFDEATASLDADTESAVMDAINSLHGEKTIILIAHRLSTIKECDVIYEISNGIASQKKYEEIM